MFTWKYSFPVIWDYLIHIHISFTQYSFQRNSTWERGLKGFHFTLFLAFQNHKIRMTGLWIKSGWRINFKWSIISGYQIRINNSFVFGKSFIWIWSSLVKRTFLTCILSTLSALLLRHRLFRRSLATTIIEEWDRKQRPNCKFILSDDHCN